MRMHNSNSNNSSSSKPAYSDNSPNSSLVDFLATLIKAVFLEIITSKSLLDRIIMDSANNSISLVVFLDRINQLLDRIIRMVLASSSSSSKRLDLVLVSARLHTSFELQSKTK